MSKFYCKVGTSCHHYHLCSKTRKNVRACGRSNPSLGDIEKSQESAFVKWFEAQHGKPPLTAAEHARLEEDVQAGRVAADLLAGERDYEARRESALLAWLAKDAARN